MDAELLYQHNDGRQQINYFNGTTKWNNVYEYATGQSVDPLSAGGNEGTDLVRSAISTRWPTGSRTSRCWRVQEHQRHRQCGRECHHRQRGRQYPHRQGRPGHADRRAGIDTFVFGTGDTGAALGSRDLVTDFTIGTDKLDLSAIDANTLLNGAQDFRFLGTSAFDGQGGALRYSYDSGRNVTVVEADFNGDRTADFAIELTGNKTLTETDFAAGSLAAGASGHRFDAGRLEAWLEREVAGFAGPLEVEQFKGGQSNPTYKLITPARDYVLCGASRPGGAAARRPRRRSRISGDHRAQGAHSGSPRLERGDHPIFAIDGVGAGQQRPGGLRRTAHNQRRSSLLVGGVRLAALELLDPERPGKAHHFPFEPRLEPPGIEAVAAGACGQAAGREVGLGHASCCR